MSSKTIKRRVEIVVAIASQREAKRPPLTQGKINMMSTNAVIRHWVSNACTSAMVHLANRSKRYQGMCQQVMPYLNFSREKASNHTYQQ